MISTIYNNPYALWKSGHRQGKTKEQINAESYDKLRKAKNKSKKDILNKQNKINMVTNEQLANSIITLAEELKVLKLRVSELERNNAASTYVAKQSTTITESNTDEVKSYPSVEDAPEWKLVFKVNTSEGISTQKVIQRAWTEKQAIFLGRSEQLFPSMNELVKAKQIQAKWNVAEVTAEKIV